MPWDRVHDEAEVLEHAHLRGARGADRGEARQPDARPARRPDPDRELEIERGADARARRRSSPARAGVFVRVSDSDPEMLRYLAERGIAPGRRASRSSTSSRSAGRCSSRFGGDVHVLGGALAARDARRGSAVSASATAAGRPPPAAERAPPPSRSRRAPLRARCARAAACAARPGAARPGVRRRGRLRRPGQLRHQHRRRRQVRLPAAVGDPRGEPDGDADPVPVGEGRHRHRHATCPSSAASTSRGACRVGLWVQAELIAMATDLAEFVGAAIALNLLFGVPLFAAGPDHGRRRVRRSSACRRAATAASRSRSSACSA